MAAADDLQFEGMAVGAHLCPTVMASAATAVDFIIDTYVKGFYFKHHVKKLLATPRFF